jgi:predicted nucleic-acid-binding protein
MTAVDTNVLARILTVENPKQSVAARTLLASESIWIAKTVLLETAWVLRNFFDFNAEAIRASFTTLLGLDNVYVEDEACVSAALALAGQGIGFADAMHLSSRPPGMPFVSFDRVFVRRAQRAGAADISTLSI